MIANYYQRRKAKAKRRKVYNARKRRPLVSVSKRGVAKVRNPLRIDPTKTAGLRRAFLAEFKRRFGRLKADIIKLVVDEDAFGLDREPMIIGNGLTANAGRWSSQPNARQLQAFRAWLRTQVQTRVLSDRAALDRYIAEGFRKGAGRSFDDVRQSELRTRRPELFAPEAQGQLRDFYRGSKDEFLRSSFGRPVAREKVELLAARSFSDLEGVTEAMSTAMSRTLTDGLVQGQSPRDVARNLVRDVDGIGLNRANTIARTETIRAHAEGQLTAMEQLGVTEVGVMVEWATAGDDKVCEACEPLEGVVLTIDEARGMLPRHPSCRCAFIPANVGEDKEDQTRTKGAIESAVRDSVEAGTDTQDEEGGSWGPAIEISMGRPESVLNAMDAFSRFLVNYNPEGCNQYTGSGCSGFDTSKYPTAKIKIDENKDVIRLEHIQVAIKGKGEGSRVMKDLISYADRVGKTVRLTPDSTYGTPLSVLVGFYKRFGFVDRGMPSGAMERPPVTTNVFCPTGEGGGIDATCTLGEGKAEVVKVAIKGHLTEVHTNPSTQGLKNWLSKMPENNEGVSGWLLGMVVGDKSYVWESVAGGDLTDIHHRDVAAKLDIEEPGEDGKFILGMRGGKIEVSPYVGGGISSTASRWAESRGMVINVFCPTGKGGGVDPSCSLGGSGQMGEGSKPSTAESPRESATDEIHERAKSDPNLSYADIAEHVESLRGHSKAKLKEIALSVGVYSTSVTSKEQLLAGIKDSLDNRKGRTHRTSVD